MRAQISALKSPRRQTVIVERMGQSRSALLPDMIALCRACTRGLSLVDLKSMSPAVMMRCKHNNIKALWYKTPIKLVGLSAEDTSEITEIRSRTRTLACICSQYVLMTKPFPEITTMQPKALRPDTMALLTCPTCGHDGDIDQREIARSRGDVPTQYGFRCTRCGRPMSSVASTKHRPER